MDKLKHKKQQSGVKKTSKKMTKEMVKNGRDASASLNGVPTSPRKMRLVANLIRGERVSSALNILKHEEKYPSVKLEKLLLSALSNWEVKNANLNLEEMDLFIKEIYVNEGRSLKRLRPAPQGRAHRIKKRSNHVTLVIDDRGKYSTTKQNLKK